MPLGKADKAFVMVPCVAAVPHVVGLSVLYCGVGVSLLTCGPYSILSQFARYS